MIILNSVQVDQKIHRIALQILENNLDSDSIILAGINNAGFNLGNMILDKLSTLADKDVQLTRIKLDPAEPLSSEVSLDIPLEDLENKTVIIVDDVANT
ncbi:MAG: phosphoribosyltransferase, partial [Saprospiraceae bacterium]|nr:phosphoribosyltransferase [Saprospiraceae bacterium]